MRTLLLSVVVAIAIAACQSAAPKPVIANHSAKPPPAPAPDPTPPYIFANACTDSMPHACDVTQCMAWKQGHGEPEDTAFGECLQDCNCGE